MIKSNWNDIKMNDYLNVKENEINNLPKGLKIITICASCKLGTNIIIENIDKYLKLCSDDILSIKINNDNLRTLIPVTNKNKRNKLTPKKASYFYNQITIIIRITHGETDKLDKEPKINLKLFKNGSIQMSGCKSLEGINIVLNKLIVKLSEIKAKIEDDKIVEKTFVENLKDLGINKFKIDMINSNYKVNMQIDRSNLFSLLMKKKIKSSFESCSRACVVIKYEPPERNIDKNEISIFIFQKGSIIITRAKNRNNIIDGYNFINNLLILIVMKL